MSFQSSAPQVIRIKRKRNEEPPDQLYIDNGKRRATADAYMFRIVRNEPEVPQIPTQFDGVPIVQATAAGEEKRNPLALKREPATPKSSIPAPAITSQQQPRSAPRRFQLSRQSTQSQLPVSTSRKRKPGIAVFVAERVRPPPPGAPAREVNREEQATQTTPEVPIQSAKLKRPATKPPRHLKNGGVIPQASNGTSTQSEHDHGFSSRMSAWAEETEREENGVVPTPSKPLPQQPVIRGSDEDMDMDDVDDDGDYVYDTYQRHFISANSPASVDEMASIGHLVITEEDQELWQTYIDDDEDEKFDTDDEDSNAEDYYGADYPEDEVDDDDEFDRNAYKYRNKGASDEEEWDENDDIALSDDEDNVRDFSGGVTPITPALDRMLE
ncbi:hypothetical protein EJ08DRAFT_738662 [Tothia fuscella]|uniref:Transcription factor Iwr1 domain-containing protein n=1 Tax=Tothia fuscella TaxID=1048955 RepID=A0A9P4NG88_9PEZI|nr:hypothetical protein EJ08DRAFT_738662 [Tothia fuscella]